MRAYAPDQYIMHHILSTWYQTPHDPNPSRPPSLPPLSVADGV
jgi:hypothetical protein